MPQPILNAPAANAAGIEMLRQHFPQAIETDAQGRIRINASALQLALDPPTQRACRLKKTALSCAGSENARLTRSTHRGLPTTSCGKLDKTAASN